MISIFGIFEFIVLESNMVVRIVVMLREIFVGIVVGVIKNVYYDNIIRIIFGKYIDDIW